MKEQLIEFETAKLAKEKGFDWKTRYYYYGTLGFLGMHFFKGIFSFRKGYRVMAPTQKQLKKWLIENHNIGIVVRPDSDNGQSLGLEYLLIEHDGFTQGATFDTYEQALEAGLIEALKLI